jgi:hypothetical protein
MALPDRATAADCQFVLGFKALHDLIPAIVGTCLVDEHHNPTNGDGLQETTGPVGGGGTGLLVWRKADNWTAYTDGFHTWINGPVGLQERQNTQCYPWEAGCGQSPPGPASGVLDLRGFTGGWARHGFSLQVNADGTGNANWRIYQWCSNAPPPCDWMNGDLLEGGGSAHLVFYKADGSVALAHVVTSTDTAAMPTGSTLTLGLLPYDAAQFSTGGRFVFLCGPHFADEAPPELFASYPCGA